MKGVVFTEFLGFVSHKFGENMVDDIIDAADLPSGGAYTSVGTYDHAEMVALCTALSEHTHTPAGNLIRAFGEHLVGIFAKSYPHFFTRAAGLFDFLASVEHHIHVEVRKLYPDAELPTFIIEARSERHMSMIYHSPRRLGALCEGLIAGSARQFGVAATIKSEPLDASDGQVIRFVIDLV